MALLLLVSQGLVNGKYACKRGMKFKHEAGLQVCMYACILRSTQ
jgi:hypothetical protein